MDVSDNQSSPQSAAGTQRPTERGKLTPEDQPTSEEQNSPQQSASGTRQTQEARRRRSAEEVVEDHLASIATQDPEAMAADYADDATLERDRRYVGRSAITSYFRTVPERLGEGKVVFGRRSRRSGGRISVQWRIAGGQADGLSGRDTYALAGGLIVHQVVELDGTDF